MNGCEVEIAGRPCRFRSTSSRTRRADNEAGLASGHADPPLSEVGRQQAAELGARLASVEFDAVYCSDLGRALETVAIALEGRDAPRYVEPRLRECDYGEWTRRPGPEVQAASRAHLDSPFPGGESYREAVARVRKVLVEAAERHPEGRVLIVGHRVTTYALAHWCDGAPLEALLAAPYEWRPGWDYRFDG